MGDKLLRDRVFQAWWRLQRPLTLGVRGVVVNGDGHVLLLRHTYTPGWHFPGGGVEHGESCGEALGRELVEEAGIVPAEPPQLVSVHDNRANFPNDHVLVYRIPSWTRTNASQRGEIADTGFFDPLDPPAGITPGTARRLAELFAGAAISERW